MEEQLESLLEILLEILYTSTGQLETIQATKKLPKTYTWNPKHLQVITQIL